MKVVHVESGLGNQMLSYCELLAIRKSNPEEKCYIETLIYDIHESHKKICQWNGYELERIFGIHEENIKTFFPDSVWRQIVSEITETKFWDKHWNYPVYFTEVFARHGLVLLNDRGDFEDIDFRKKRKADSSAWRSCLKNTKEYRILKKLYYSLKEKQVIYAGSEKNKLFQYSEQNLFTGQRLSFKYKGNGIEDIDTEIRNAFQFPALEIEKDIRLFNMVRGVNSVAIHARRGDMLTDNGYCYKNGYFNKAVKFLKKQVADPVFLFFCDPGSIEWCKENQRVFGLDFKTDKVIFVDWHTGLESYRDMQLMAQCKHNIITNSSFGWWGSYFNDNPDKITISPDCRINTTHWF